MGGTYPNLRETNAWAPCPEPYKGKVLCILYNNEKIILKKEGKNKIYEN